MRRPLRISGPYTNKSGNLLTFTDKGIVDNI